MYTYLIATAIVWIIGTIPTTIIGEILRQKHREGQLESNSILREIAPGILPEFSILFGILWPLVLMLTGILYLCQAVNEGIVWLSDELERVVRNWRNG